MKGNDVSYSFTIGKQIASDLAEFTNVASNPVAQPMNTGKADALPPGDQLLTSYDSRVSDIDLRTATRSRFISKHYADAVEAGVKALNECVRLRSGLTEDGDALMTTVFSPNKPLLRINKGKSKSDESAQRGHMFLCQGVVGAWRNPRAHSNLADTSERALMMLSTINDLIEITKSATRARQRRNP
jgi:uncharacterized protein (TIGR02391 family)